MSHVANTRTSWCTTPRSSTLISLQLTILGKLKMEAGCLHASRSYGGKQRCSSTHSQFRHQMKASGRLHSGPFTPRKVPPSTHLQEVGWAQSLCVHFGEMSFIPLGFDPQFLGRRPRSQVTIGMRRITTFRSTTDRICDGGPIIL